MRGSLEVENPLHYLPNSGIDIVLFEDGKINSDLLVFNVKTYINNGSLFKQVILSPVSHSDPKSFEFRYDRQNDRTGPLFDSRLSHINFIGRGYDGNPMAEIMPSNTAGIRYRILDIDHKDLEGYWIFHPESDTAFSYDPEKRLFTPLNYDSEFPCDLNLREICIL